MASFLIWLIAAATIAGVIFRPYQWPEAVWACLGALTIVLTGVLTPGQAITAIGRGADVYLFLAGMMLLAEMARDEGVFDWMASLALTLAGQSPARLFTLVYLVGIVVTVFLSNDATAVVLTPAVYTAVRRAQVKASPYLFICALIANAASFVLPISNPANLVVYGKHMPPLLVWLRTYLTPSLFAIVSTYLFLRYLIRKDLKGTLPRNADSYLSKRGKRVAVGILLTGLILIFASLRGMNLGLPTCAAAVLMLLLTASGDFAKLLRIGRRISWSVLALVAGLFVLVEAMSQAGAQHAFQSMMAVCDRLPSPLGLLAASFGIATLSNLMNNLPSGLLAAGAVQSHLVPPYLRGAVLIGVDLGPNLSVTGSLATLLWLTALRGEGEHITGWQFLKIGSLVMPPALLLSTLALLIVEH